MLFNTPRSSPQLPLRESPQGHQGVNASGGATRSPSPPPPTPVHGRLGRQSDQSSLTTARAPSYRVAEEGGGALSHLNHVIAPPRVTRSSSFARAAKPGIRPWGAQLHPQPRAPRAARSGSRVSVRGCYSPRGKGSRTAAVLIANSRKPCLRHPGAHRGRCRTACRDL